VHITAAADYAVRAALTLAAREAEGGPPVTADELAEAQQLPRKFLDQVLGSLRRAGLVHSQRGAQGGYRLALHASDISVADVIRAVEGPMAHVRGLRPEMLEYEGEAAHLQDVWVAVRASLRSVLENTSLADVVNGTLPKHVQKLVDNPDSWEQH
jgi:Rrf2 family protein